MGTTDSGGPTPERLIDRATALGADYVIPNDVIGKHRLTAERTQALFSYLDRTTPRAAPSVLVPLQPPYEDHLDLLAEDYPRQYRAGQFCCGGLLQFDDPERKVAHLRGARNHLGNGAYIHALGLGASVPFIRAVRARPGLVDSCDLSTPQRLAASGAAATARWQSVSLDLPQGTDVSTPQGALTEQLLLTLAYQLSPLPDEDTVFGRDSVAGAQTDLAGYATDGGQPDGAEHLDESPSDSQSDTN